MCSLVENRRNGIAATSYRLLIVQTAHSTTCDHPPQQLIYIPKMYGLKLTLLLLSMLTMMAAAIMAPSLPDIALEFKQLPHVELLSKLILSIPAIMIAIIAPFVGRFIDKFGRLKLLYVGLVIYAISGTSGYFLNDLYFILISRMLLGVGISIIMTIAITMVGDYFEGEARQKFVGYQSAFIGMAGVVFMSLGGYLATIHWRLPFLIYLFSLLLIPLSIIFLEESSQPLIHQALV